MFDRFVMRLCCMTGVLALSACQTWQPIEVAPLVLIAERAPKELRFTLATSEQYVLATPLARADSIVGQVGPRRIAFSTRQLSLVEERRFSPTRTAVVGGIAFVGYILFRGFFEGDRVSK